MIQKYPTLVRVATGLVIAAMAAMAYRAYGWAGLALAAGALVMWSLMHMSRMLLILRRTAHRPVGTVASAVMLNAGLHRGMALLQVLALTRALGQRLDAPDAQSEVYQWSDGGNATVRCTFEHGKLARWELLRP